MNLPERAAASGTASPAVFRRVLEEQVEAGGPRRVDRDQGVRLGPSFDPPDQLPPERTPGAWHEADIHAGTCQFYEAVDDGRFDPLHVEPRVCAVEYSAHGIAA